MHTVTRRFALLTIAACAATFAASACGDPAPKVGEWHDAEGYRWRDLDVARASRSPVGARAGLTSLPASRTGLTHENRVEDEHALANRNLLIGAGAALGDVDGDGYPDLFLASVERPAKLYKNLGGLQFRDVTTESGLATDSLASTGAVLVDVDGDRDLDLLVGTLGGPVKLWLNDGKGTFTDATTGSGLTGGYAATTLTLADVDADGDLDLYVATYKVRNALDAYPPQARQFDQVVTKTATGYAVKPEWVREYRIEDRPDLGGIVRSQRADPDLFFINVGGGRFEQVPIRGDRFRDARGNPLTAEPDFFTLAARFYDVNGDGAPDLYVCNDFEDPDQFWLNDGRGNFRLAPDYALTAMSNTCMSVDFGDVNRDGLVDLFTADMLSPTLAERQARIPTHTPLGKPVGTTAERPQWMRNMLHLSRGDGSWAEIGEFAGVGATDWTWGSAFLDVDLDGFEDLLTVNGHRWDIRHADTFDRIRDKFPRTAWNREQGEFPLLATRSIALRNNGDLTFRAMPGGWGLGDVDAISQGIALADLDLDGDLDVIVTRLNAPVALMRNDASAPRVAVRLVGAAPNSSGVGARVTVRASSLPAQQREMTAGGYYLSGSVAELTFATGTDTAVVIEVEWADGRRSVVTGARTNRLYEINAAGAAARAASPTATSTAISTAISTATGTALFENATARLGGHTHHDSLFDDFRRQPLLPSRLSQLGPGVAWIDTDGDGREDLIVGDGRGGSLTVLRNLDGRFVAERAPGRVGGDLTTIVPFVGAAARAVLAGQSNYEANTAATALGLARVLAFGAGSGGLRAGAPLVSGDTASVGPLAVADVNGDGWLDLFVGPRVTGGAWPLPAPSRLYLGAADGRLVLDTANSAVLANLGLLSAATLADLDADGAPELIVAGEFGPVRVLQNGRGLFRDRTREFGLSDLRSRWNGIAVGDFDGDGRADIVATSWGRNTSWAATAARPYVLFAGGFGGSDLGLVFARADSVTASEMPLESFARLGVAFPALRSRVATYEEFAAQPVDSLFPGELARAARVGATTFDHTLLLRRGDRFESRALPAAAQLAPSFGVAVADFDGDGREDLFLAQNFFPTEISTARFDNGIGLVLLGDGAGGFRALDLRESGIVMRGDQRGAAVADFDADGRVDLAVGQNGGATQLWRNANGRPGLRVRLDGGVGNPHGIGAQLRIESTTGLGPLRVLRAGSGYWSTDGAITVMALPAGAHTLLVRWPSGREERVAITTGIGEQFVRYANALVTR